MLYLFERIRNKRKLLLRTTLPVFGSLKTIVDRQKKRTGHISKSPAKRADLKSTDDQRNFKGEDFLLSDENGSNEILMFGTEKFIRPLSRTDSIYLDGTFNVCLDIYN